MGQSQEQSEGRVQECKGQAQDKVGLIDHAIISITPSVSGGAKGRTCVPLPVSCFARASGLFPDSFSDLTVKLWCACRGKADQLQGNLVELRPHFEFSSLQDTCPHGWKGEE